MTAAPRSAAAVGRRHEAGQVVRPDHHDGEVGGERLDRPDLRRELRGGSARDGDDVQVDVEPLGGQGEGEPAAEGVLDPPRTLAVGDGVTEEDESERSHGG